MGKRKVKVLRVFVVDYLGSILFAVPMALIFGTISWFLDPTKSFKRHVVQNYKNMFLVSSVLRATGLVGMYVLIILLSKELELSYEEIEEAVMTLQLHKKKPLSEWTTPWVRHELELAKGKIELANFASQS